MGLIRKSLSLGTAGVVKGSSKKQRTAKQTRDAIREQIDVIASTAAQQVFLARSAMVGEAQAHREALEQELAALPVRFARTMRQAGRARQIERELAAMQE